ncbi:MAG: hypothetical protein A2908_02700 [Candidatus Staskawiczbacteria bacterium RIFCSPLOWO2_01_FULL_38_12b]|uniref:Uncharacterized protein n=1 Tax=Candidatus Staskawiczbacteria bacterium RIFCSPLOWO2_01_FULL_38_12b TaxID=1802214 RepID=A0A1G2IH51_9BACT|nr:MAG: hypothetical protein A2908_02700 [Candidatus Staskawiczbacteria bacterium RIFCSPLOWO2_01_FULL_38_12b]
MTNKNIAILVVVLAVIAISIGVLYSFNQPVPLDPKRQKIQEFLMNLITITPRNPYNCQEIFSQCSGPWRYQYCKDACSVCSCAP